MPSPPLPAAGPLSREARLGRFLLIELLGEGGMGTVLSAFDPRLQRRVALKVLREKLVGSPAGHARMLREAQALARMTHPNVVPIHEVLEVDGRIVLVMEHVAGLTLREWVAAERPGWREIVSTYLQAGRGLVAAHASGLVHRDFKPSNAIVGTDGRVRVIDFGLVRHEAGPDPISAPVAGAEASPPDRLTSAGVVLGTPAYMAPEQLARADAGPRTDVYAFCVSLCEALYGERPFPGAPGFKTGEGQGPPRRGRVPRRLWTILRPGLSEDAGARPASLEPILAALSRAVARRRWTPALAVAPLLASVGVAIAPPGEPACSGGAEEIEAVFNPAVAATVQRRLADTLGAYAAQVLPRIQRELGRYATVWKDEHRAACLAHRRGEQSEVLLDRRMHCLDRHRQALAAAVALLGRGGAGDPIRLVAGLPPPAACSNLELLTAAQPLPSDPAARLLLRSLEGKLEGAAASERNGDYGRAAAVAREVTLQAPRLHSPRLEAAAHLQLGRAQLLAGQLADADAPLRAAQRFATAGDAPEIAAEAIARRIFVQGVGGTLERDRMAELHTLAEDFLVRAREGGFARALLLNNVGVVFRNLDRRDLARGYLRQARQARSGVKRFDPELLVITDNLAAVTDDPAEREALFDEAAHEAEAALGAMHPETLRTRVVRASTIVSPRRRHADLTGVCRDVERFQQGGWSTRATCALELAWAAEELEKPVEAAAHYARASAHFHRIEQGLFAGLARGQAARLVGRGTEARAAFAEVDAALGRPARRPWQIALRAVIDQARAEMAAEVGQHRQAARRAQGVLSALAAVDIAGQVHWQVVAARARVTAATSLLAIGGQSRGRRAADLLEAARRWYRKAGAGYERRVRDIERWIARAERETPAPPNDGGTGDRGLAHFSQ